MGILAELEERVWQEILAEFAEWAIDILCDCECESCGRPINLPDKERIKEWLKEGK